MSKTVQDRFQQHENNEFIVLQAGIAGEVTSDTTVVAGVVPSACRVTGVILSTVANGSDDTDALTMAAIAKVNGTAVCSTNPSFLKTAASDAAVSTVAAGTGITQAVVKSDGTEDLAAGDVITVMFDITRTTPDTEIDTPACVVVCQPL